MSDPRVRRCFTAALGTAFLALLSSTAWAQRDLSRWEDMFSQDASPLRMRYGATSYAEEKVRGQDNDFSLVQQDFSASARVYTDDHDEVWLQGGMRFQEIRTQTVLPDTGAPFPDDLWDVHVGVTYKYLIDRDSSVGGSVSVGSASDHPFNSNQEMVESIMVFYRMPAGDRDAWLFFIGYSNNREYANSYPIPGVEYFYNPSREFHAMVGFPMESLEWRPTEDFTFTVRYSLIHNIHAQATYRLAEPLRVYAGFDWNTQGYLLVDRPDPKDRFFYDEKRVKAGVKVTLVDGLVFDLGGGFAFDRSYWESQHGLRQKFDRVDIDSGLYALATLEFRLGRSEERRKAKPENPQEEKD